MKTKHRKIGQLTVLSTMDRKLYVVRYWLLLFAFALWSSVCFGDSLPDSLVQDVANRWLTENGLFWNGRQPAIVFATHLASDDGEALPMMLFHLSPAGYLVMSTDTALPVVIAFSAHGHPETALTEEKPFQALLLAQGKSYQAKLKKQPKTRNGQAGPDADYWDYLLKKVQLTRGSTITPESSEIVLDNFVTTEWNQFYPYNLLCPVLNEPSNRAPTGCVITAFTQIMNYYRWPTYGKGKATWTDNEGNLYATLMADLSRGYDWEAMRSLGNESSPDIGDLEVARLMLDFGILAKTNWEIAGSGGNIAHKDNRAYLQECLRYQNIRSLTTDSDSYWVYYGHAEYATFDELKTEVRQQVVAKQPAYLVVPTSRGVHAVITSGLASVNSTDYFYLNYGWGGSEHGWYRLDSAFENQVVTEACVNIIPKAIPIIRPMSRAQGSSFAVSWDFPWCHTASDFRLFVRDAYGTLVKNESYNGTTRSASLSSLPVQELAITVEAKVNGVWQGESEPLTVNVLSSTPPVLTVSVASDVTCITGRTKEIPFSASQAIASVSLSTNRPDIFPENQRSVSFSGKDGTIELQMKAGMCGRSIVWLDVTDICGGTASKKIQIEGLLTEKLVWATTLAEAKARAAAENKLILMVAGKDTDFWTNTVRSTYCDEERNKAIIQDYIVPWYCNAASSYEFYQFSNGCTQYYPIVALVSANGTQQLRVVDGTTWRYYDEDQNVGDPDGFHDFLDLSGLIDQFEMPYLVTVIHATASSYGAHAGDTIIVTATLPPDADPSEYSVTWSFSPSVVFAADGITATFTMPASNVTATCTAEFESDYTYTIYNDLVTITGYTGSDTALVIPSTIEGKPVVAIATAAFMNCTALTSVAIPQGVTAIGSHTFWGCSGLTSVIIPEGVESIGYAAFYKCSSLMNLTLPSSVTTIDDFAFECCDSLSSVTIPSNVTSIGSYAFYACPKLKTMEFLGEPPVFGSYSYSTPVTFYAYAGHGWENWNVPSGVVLTIRDLTVESIAINGSATIETSGTVNYVCSATWNDGMTTTVSPTWSVTPNTYASVSKAGIVTNKNTTTTDQTATLTASYTVNGVTKTASKSITLAKKELTGIAISGFDSIATASTATYTCTASWSYGDSTTEVIPTWSLSSTTYASVSTSGVVTNQNTMTTDQMVTLTANYTVNGVTKTDTKTITLKAEIPVSVTQTLTLESGWNWVSFHILPESHKVGDVLGTAGFTANDIIQTNGVSARFTGNRWHLENFTVEFGKMYQIYVANAVMVEISGGASGALTVPLTTGWNWIGNPTSSAVSLSLLTHNGGWTANDRIQTSGGVSATYTGNGWVPADFTLELGKGYQIHTAKAGILTFPNEPLYAVVDLSGGPNATNYPVRYTNEAPNLSDNTCRTMELWLRRIPAGTFIMGSPEDEAGRYDNETQHYVTLTQDYYIGVFECTQKQWELVMGSNPSYNKGDDRPVENITYNLIRGASPGASGTIVGGWPSAGHTVEADSFMGVLRTKTGLTFDLPTEAQWEYACRAGTTTALNSGKNLLTPSGTGPDANMDEVGRYCENVNDGKGGYIEHTTVGSYLPNAWGLYDMHGNLYEWCLDWYGDYNLETTLDPVGAGEGTQRVLRSGNWSNTLGGKASRSAYRWHGSSTTNFGGRAGFRIVLLP